MNNRERRAAESAKIYEKEFDMLDRIHRIQTSPDASPDLLSKYYSELGKEYERLLKKTVKITRVGDSNQRKLLAANEQIERQKEELSLAYQKLDLISREDPLTKLSNRRDFIEKFSDEIHRFERKRGSFSILLADIDDFKTINDNHGHDCGDTILVQIAQLIRSAVRKLDCVARWGGEEFILMLPDTPLEGALKVAEDIRERIQNSRFRFNDITLSITTSIGVCPFVEGMDRDICIANADKALYQGKRLGKNKVIQADFSGNIQEDGKR